MPSSWAPVPPERRPRGPSPRAARWSGCRVVVAPRRASFEQHDRGPFPGAKNMYGGVIYGRILDTVLPRWWEEAPVQRWVTRRSTMMLTEDQALTIDYRTSRWGTPPYNGATAYRPDFDAWLAGKAEAEGSTLVTSTTA